MTGRFRAAAAAAGVAVIHIHDGRHTAATLRVEGGVDVKLVSDQLGHRSTGLTADVYQHVCRPGHDAAAGVVDRLVFGADGTGAERTSTRGVTDWHGAGLRGRRPAAQTGPGATT